MDIYEYVKPLGKIQDDSELRKRLIDVYDVKSHREVAAFCIEYGRHLGELAGFGTSKEMEASFAAIRKWMEGKTNYHEARNLAGVFHSMARDEKDAVRARFYRTMAQVSAVTHVKYHGLWATDFAVTLVNRIAPGDMDAVRKERLNQIELLERMHVSETKEADLLLDAIRRKQEMSSLVKSIESKPELIGVLLNIINEDTGSAKFYCDKALQKLSETNPSLVYPYFHEISRLLDSKNNFIKWGAIRTVSNLLAVDTEKRFDPISDKYFGLIDADSMITAANVIGGAWKYVLAFPEKEGDITARLLKVMGNTYLYKGELSPECRNIAIGHVIDCFDKYFELSASQGKMLEFAGSQKNNSRKSTAKKASAFLKKHSSAQR